VTPSQKLGTEERLIEVAKQQLTRHGIYGLEIRTLAKLANTSTSRFHAYFECRDELLARIFDEGWLLVGRHIGDKLLAVEGGLEDSAVAVIDGALAAFEEDPATVGATAIIWNLAFGQPLVKRLRETEGFAVYRRITETFMARFGRVMPKEDAAAAVQTIFAAVVRHIVRATPGYARETASSASVGLKRKVVLRSMRATIRGHLNMAEDNVLPDA